MNDILSPDTLHSLALLWKGLLWPLLRLLLGLCVGLLLANLLEALRWTRHLARLATPLARAAHLRDVAGAAFSLAFVSPAAANGLLSESHQKGEIDGRELMLANLFNSFPAYLVHTPTIFLLTWPVLGWPAVVYVGLTLLAAVGRTGLTIAFSRRLLPAPPQGCLACTAAADGETGWRAAARKAWKRFRRRVPKLVCFTVPVYIIMYLLQRYGLFTAAEEWLAMHMEWLAFLKPPGHGHHRAASGRRTGRGPGRRRQRAPDRRPRGPRCGACPDGGQHIVHAHAGHPPPAARLRRFLPPGPGPAPDPGQPGPARRQHGRGHPAVLVGGVLVRNRRGGEGKRFGKRFSLSPSRSPFPFPKLSAGAREEKDSLPFLHTETGIVCSPDSGKTPARIWLKASPARHSLP